MTMATSDLAQYLQALPCPNCGAYHYGPHSVPRCQAARAIAHWAVWDHEDTSRWGNQLNREAFVKLAKDPMKAMG